MTKKISPVFIIAFCLYLHISFFSLAECTIIGYVDPYSINSSNWGSQISSLGGSINNTLNFESHSLGTVGSVTLSSSTSAFSTGVGPGQGNNTGTLPGEGQHASSRYLNFGTSGNLIISFDSNVLGVGFQTIDLFSSSTVSIQAYTGINATGTLLGTYTRASGTNFQINNVFYMGIIDTTGNIRSVRFNFTEGGGDVIGLDNIQFSSASAPSATLSSNNTNFGNVRVGTSNTATVTVTNTGASGSTLTGTIGAATGSEFSPVSGTQSFSLSQSQSSVRTYTYTPTARGADSTTISISSNVNNTTASLTGTGVSPVYSSSVAPNSTIDFGTVDKNITLTQTLTIQNITPDADLGNLTNLTLLSATISGADASYFSIENFTPGTVLSKNGLLNLLIKITNSDYLVETRNATLTIVTDENAALGVSGNIYTYHLTAYLVPEQSTYIFMSIAGLLLGIFRFYRKSY